MELSKSSEENFMRNGVDESFVRHYSLYHSRRLGECISESEASAPHNGDRTGLKSLLHADGLSIFMALMSLYGLQRYTRE
jgi:hypothetical protein